MASSDRKTADRPKSPAEIPPVPEDIGKLPTKAARIRALAALGWERAAIAKALGVRYQQVRNTLGPMEKPATAAKAAPRTRAGAKRANPAPSPEPQPARKPEPAEGPASTAGPEPDPAEPDREPFPTRHLWRLPGILAFGAIAALLLGLLELLAFLRLIVRLAGMPGEETLASGERPLSAWLLQILDYLRETDRIDDLPFPFSPLP